MQEKLPEASGVGHAHTQVCAYVCTVCVRGSCLHNSGGLAWGPECRLNTGVMGASFVSLRGEEAGCVFIECIRVRTYVTLGVEAGWCVWGVHGAVAGCVVWRQMSKALWGSAEWEDM